MNIFYKGEDIFIIFSSENDISDYTKAVKVFTPLSSVKTATISEIDDNSFSATITSTQTADLKTGNFNIVLELTQGGSKAISKTVKAKLNDAYLDGGEREDSNSYTYQINFTDGNHIDINFGANFIVSQIYGWFIFIWNLFTGFTIAELRLLTNSQLALVSSFSCKEQGRIKDWYYDSTDTTSADNNGTILVTTSGKRLKAKNYEYLTPENFGAIGDGIVNDYDSFNNLVNSNISTIKLGNKKKYLISNELFINKNIKKFVGNDSTFIPSSSLLATNNSSILNFSTTKSSTSVSINVTKDNNFIDLSTINFNIGDVILFKSNDIYQNFPDDSTNNYLHGQYAIIVNKIGSIAYLSTPFYASYTVNNITIYEPYDGLLIENTNFDVSLYPNNTNVHIPLKVKGCNIKLQNINAIGNDYAMVGCIIEGENYNINECNFSKFFNIQGLTSSRVGYGLAIGANNTTVNNCSFFDCKHAITIATRQYLTGGSTVIKNSTFNEDYTRTFISGSVNVSSGYAGTIDFHAGVFDTPIVQNNKINCHGRAFFIRNGNIVIENNIVNQKSNAVSLVGIEEKKIDSFIFSNNTVNLLQNTTSTIIDNYNTLVTGVFGSINNILINNNIITNGSIIRFNNINFNVNNMSLVNNSIYNCEFVFSTGITNTNSVISNLTIANNTITQRVGGTSSFYFEHNIIENVDIINNIFVNGYINFKSIVSSSTYRNIIISGNSFSVISFVEPLNTKLYLIGVTISNNTLKTSDSTRVIQFTNTADNGWVGSEPVLISNNHLLSGSTVASVFITATALNNKLMFRNNVLFSKIDDQSNTFFSILGNVIKASPATQPYKGGTIINYDGKVLGGSVPTTGTWVLGDIIYNNNPISGSYTGWVCTASGTPGTWKTFGLIS